jgi:hypothetical protein
VPASKLKWVREILTDALARPSRLTAWERTFLADTQSRLSQRGDRFTLTDGQEVSLKQIEGKIYALS